MKLKQEKSTPDEKTYRSLRFMQEKKDPDEKSNLVCDDTLSIQSRSEGRSLEIIQIKRSREAEKQGMGKWKAAAIVSRGTARTRKMNC